MPTKRDLQRALDAMIRQRDDALKRKDDALKKAADLEAFVKDLFYLHPPLKETYYSWHDDGTFYGQYRPKYEYVATLAEAKRNVETLNSADLAKIDRYLEAVLGEEEA